MVPITRLVMHLMNKRPQSKNDVVRALGYRNTTHGLRQLDAFLAEVNVPNGSFLKELKHHLHIRDDIWKSAWDESIAALVLEQDTRLALTDQLRYRDFQPHLRMQYRRDRLLGWMGHLVAEKHRTIPLPPSAVRCQWTTQMRLIRNAMLRKKRKLGPDFHRIAGPVIGAVYRPHYRSTRFLLNKDGDFLGLLDPALETRRPEYTFSSGSRTRDLDTLREWIRDAGER